MSALPELTVLSAFVVGLMSGVHCAAMCGGIVAAISRPASKGASSLLFHFAYNGGRIASYGVAGALVGALGSAGLLFREALWLQQLFAIIASLMLVALGLSVAGVAPFAQRLEAAGALLWQRIQPISRRFLPVTSPPRAFGLGLLWGWLPCGLVYMALLAALATADPLWGASIMIAFGLGTLPNLIGMGALYSRFRAVVQSKRARLIAGVMIFTFGLYAFSSVFHGMTHSHGSPSHLLLH